MGNPKMKVRGETYTPDVLLVTERDQLGRPMMGRFVHDEQKVDLSELAAGGSAPEFIIVFANKGTWGRAVSRPPGPLVTAAERVPVLGNLTEQELVFAKAQGLVRGPEGEETVPRKWLEQLRGELKGRSS